MDGNGISGYKTNTDTCHNIQNPPTNQQWHFLEIGSHHRCWVNVTHTTTVFEPASRYDVVLIQTTVHDTRSLSTHFSTHSRMNLDNPRLDTDCSRCLQAVAWFCPGVYHISLRSDLGNGKGWILEHAGAEYHQPRSNGSTGGSVAEWRMSDRVKLKERPRPLGTGTP